MTDGGNALEPDDVEEAGEVRPEVLPAIARLGLAALAVAALVERDVVLEVCPTSNLRTRAVASLDEHPLATLVAAGVPVSINSDDPSMFGTTLEGEYAVAARLLGLKPTTLNEMIKRYDIRPKRGKRAASEPDKSG